MLRAGNNWSFWPVKVGSGELLGPWNCRAVPRGSSFFSTPTHSLKYFSRGCFH